MAVVAIAAQLLALPGAAAHPEELDNCLPLTPYSVNATEKPDVCIWAHAQAEAEAIGAKCDVTNLTCDAVRTMPDGCLGGTYPEDPLNCVAAKLPAAPREIELNDGSGGRGSGGGPGCTLLDCVGDPPCVNDLNACTTVQLTPFVVRQGSECIIQAGAGAPQPESTCVGWGGLGVWLGTFCTGREFTGDCWNAYGPRKCDNTLGNHEYGWPQLEQDNNIRSVFPAGNCWWKLYEYSGYLQHWATCYPYMNGHCPDLSPITSSIALD